MELKASLYNVCELFDTAKAICRVSVYTYMCVCVFVDDIDTVSNKLNSILYADDITLTNPLCSFTYGANNGVNHLSSRIIFENFWLVNG